MIDWLLWLLIGILLFTVLNGGTLKSTLSGYTQQRRRNEGMIVVVVVIGLLSFLVQLLFEVPQEVKGKTNFAWQSVLGNFVAVAG